MYDHDGTHLHSDCDPETMPRKTTRGRKAACTCCKPECRYCRRKAAQRRWYAENVAAELEAKARYRARIAAAEPEETVSDTELDRRASVWLEERGLL